MKVTVAVTQMPCSDDLAGNLDRAEALVRRAAADGADVVLLPELFAGPYFCQDRDPAPHLDRAQPAAASAVVERVGPLAGELGVVLPVSFYERSGDRRFNAVCVYDADGSALGVYRKSHVPNDPGYWEKAYFADGDTGFRVWDTAFGRIGVGICWDQWFPEAARVMALMGADLLPYPTAIGSDPLYPGGSPMAQWRRCMQGHAAASFVPVAASNRVGREQGTDGSLTFLGSSFVTDHHGAVLVEVDTTAEAVALATIDLAAVRRERTMWGLLADRRPDLYGRLTTPLQDDAPG